MTTKKAQETPELSSEEKLKLLEMEYAKLKEEKEEIEKEKEELEAKKATPLKEIASNGNQSQEYLNERVSFMAFKDNKDYKDDITVCVNGKLFVIQRGVPVMIPRYVYFAIQNSEAQRLEAANLMDKLNNSFAKSSQERGITI